jgi:hypothetical protein
MRVRVRGAAVVLTPWMGLAFMLMIETAKRW